MNFPTGVSTSDLAMHVDKTWDIRWTLCVKASALCTKTFLSRKHPARTQSLSPGLYKRQRLESTGHSSLIHKKSPR
jgi:hypothetical protein